MGKEPWTEMYRIIAICWFGVARCPVTVKRSSDGYRKMDVMTSESTKSVVILSSSAPMNKKESLTHFKLPLLHMFGIFEDHAIVRLKVR
jgi:hypothetical protein